MVATSTGFLSSPARVMTCMVPRSNLAHVTRFHKMTVACLGVLLILSGFSASAAASTPSAPAQPAATTEGPMVVIGIGGLLWGDITAEKTPALFDLVDSADLSSLSVRTQGEITCPADGWLTLATGRRTLAGERGTDPVCALPPALQLTGTQPAVDLEEISAVNDEFGWCSHLGDRKSTRLNSSHVAISYAV